MNYYWINNDLETKAVGKKYPQVECNNQWYAHAIPDFGPCKNKFKLSFNLVKGTKLTDVLSTVSISASGFIISERFRKILENYKLEQYELIPAEIINRDQTYNYYFLHFYGLDMVHYLDYQQTIFRIIRRFTDLGTKKFDYFDSYMTFLKEFDEECSLIVHLDNLVLKEEFNDFDMFSFPNFGHDIFISERMKQCIEEYRITGLSIKKNFLDYLGEFRIDGTAENAKFK